MKASIGSVGLLKCALLKLASLQMNATNEQFKIEMLSKAVKSKKALEKIESDAAAGEENLIGSTYGESMFADADVLESVMQNMRTPPTVASEMAA